MNKHISILIQSHFDDSFCYLYLIEMGKLSDNVLPVDAAVTVCLGILLRLPKSGDQYPFFYLEKCGFYHNYSFQEDNKPRKNKKMKALQQLQK